MAANLASVLARRRGARVLGVDAGLGAGFTRMTAARPDTGEPSAAAPRTEVRLHSPVTVNQAGVATAHLLTGVHGLRVCRPGLNTRLPTPSPSDWVADVTRLTRFFDVVVTDWGHRMARADFERAVVGAHVVAVVCRADRFGVEQAVAVARAVERVAPVVVCATDVDGVGITAARTAIRSRTVPVRFIPFLTDSAAPSARYRDAVIGLAAALMDATSRHSIGGAL